MNEEETFEEIVDDEPVELAEPAEEAAAAPAEGIEIDQTVYLCKLCNVEQVGRPLADKFYCQSCSDHLHQAYQWLQSPMLSASELKSLQQKIVELTDVDNIKF